MNTKAPLIMLAAWAILALAACKDDAPAGNPGSGSESPPATNRVDIPPPVRSNLGITFVKIERRRIEKTLRAPGKFEYLPTARREYRTMLPGRVELLTEQFESVEADRVLYRIESPAWREMQQRLSEAESDINRLATKLSTLDPLRAAHDRHEESLQESIAVWMERLENLDSIREAGGGRMSEATEARASLAAARADLADVQEINAQLDASRAETKADLAAARTRLRFLLDSASAITGIARDLLVETTPANEPRWAVIDTIEVRAVEAGVVEELGLTNGSWADEKAMVVRVVQPERLRFHASGLQSDLGALQDGLDARIVPPTPTMSGRAVPLDQTMHGRLRLGLSGQSDERTIDLYVTPDEILPWARPGVAAQLEIVTDSTASAELAVPLAAVQRDGLVPVIFRRDPRDPSKAIRMEADLGQDDGRWVAVLSGVQEGDEVVLDGAFQLMLATSGSIQKGGHFHSDGTFHEGDHE